MQFVYDSVTMWATRHESKIAMEAVFERAGVAPCPVDTSEGCQRNFWSLRLTENLAPDDKLSCWGVALCCGRNGLLPQTLVLPAQKRLLLGSDSCVVLIAMGEAIPLKQIRLESPVYSLSHFAERDELLVVYETGLGLLTLDGETKWNVALSDVVSGIALRENRILEICLMEGGRQALELATGSPVEL